MARANDLQIIKILAEEQRRKKENKINYFQPYPWQKRFFLAGTQYRQRMLMAANRVGKTQIACVELSFHLTGLYPEWWEGVRFEYPINAWALGVSGEQIRDVLQKELFGILSAEGFEGGGMVQKSLISQDIVRSMTPKLAKDVRVKHVTGGHSIVSFKSYSQGQHALMGSSVDYALIDEEPQDSDIWPQVLTRTATGCKGKGGHVVLTFTPENGRTPLVVQFMDDLTSGQYLQTATWDDAPHLDDDAKRILLESYPEYQREMRSKGVPMMGVGLVFPISDDFIAEPAIESMPRFWPRICGMDFGWDHPTALVWIAYDRDNDIVHIYDCWKKSQCSAIDVGGVVRPRADEWVPVAWPHDGFQHDKGSSLQLKDQYEKQGLNMLPRNATFEDGSNGVEAGIMDMYDRMRAGRLKVAKHLEQWFEEKRIYHRKHEGGKSVLVKLNDDILSATRYAIMMLRYAETEPRPSQVDYGDAKKETWY